jgi:hypothetical protein
MERRIALNRKLTPILVGRTIKSAIQSDGVLIITFDDGSTMKIKTGGQVPVEALPNHTIKRVRQQGTIMKLDFSDNSTVELKLAEATSSVMLRNKDKKLEYAD